MNKPLRIVADAHIWGVQESFSSLPGFDIELNILEHHQITAEAVKHAHVLLTRSSTQVNASLLSDSSVKFAATATIGDDHYDKQWLDQQRIAWATAAGSSTDSVIEYMLAALFELQTRGLIDFRETRLGIIGAGRIGGKLHRILSGFQMPVLVNDPPRQREEGDDGFVSLNELLQSCDVLTLHTPLIRQGEDCTFHLLDDEKLRAFAGKGIINAGRGACIDNQALLAWLNADQSRWAVLDCWEHEPEISYDLLHHQQVVIATPHIAGHSLDGKAANTQFVYDALCRFLNIQGEWHMDQSLPEIENPVIQADSLGQAVRALYPIMADDRRLRETEKFRDLRRYYPVRRGWHHFKINIQNNKLYKSNLQNIIQVMSDMVFREVRVQ